MTEPVTDTVHPDPRPTPRPASSRVRLHVFLFVATCFSTFLVYGAGGDVAGGIAYAASIMAILTAHEMGHYVFCRRYRIPATLPYFIPLPITIFGTMGAVIRMGGPIRSRRALFDIAVAGPIAGLVVAIPVLIVGLARSAIVDGAPEGSGIITLGEPLLMRALAAVIVGPLPEGQDLLLDPFAFAGWAGLFVTAINLLPAGQLDGGHVLYALLGRRSRRVGLGVILGLVALSLVTGHPTWLVFAAFIFLFGFRHPETRSDAQPLDPARRRLAVAMILVFLACFTPVPISLG